MGAYLNGSYIAERPVNPPESDEAVECEVRSGATRCRTEVGEDEYCPDCGRSACRECRTAFLADELAWDGSCPDCRRQLAGRKPQ